MIFALIGLVLLLSAFFSASESAYRSANRVRAELSSRGPSRAAEAVRGFYADPSSLLLTTFLGNRLALVLFATLVFVGSAAPLGRLFLDAPAVPAGLAWWLSVGVQTLVAALLLIVFGEILPRVAAQRSADRALFVLALPLRAAIIILTPLKRLVLAASAAVTESDEARRADFREVLLRDFELAVVDDREADPEPQDAGTMLLENVLEMADTRVRESMVPRTAIVAVDEKASLAAVREQFIDSGFSKLPVFRESLDQIIGVVFARDLFDRPASLAQLMRQVRYVPESKLSKELLREFLEANSSIAIVIDEYGGTAGLVTREDLLEELFGDIQDEFDIEEDVMRQIGDNVFIVSGRTEVEELNERYDLGLEEGDYETVAGLVLEYTGGFPSVQQVIDINGIQFTVLRGTANRIDLLKITR